METFHLLSFHLYALYILYWYIWLCHQFLQKAHIFQLLFLDTMAAGVKPSRGGFLMNYSEFKVSQDYFDLKGIKPQYFAV